jgi:GNAT superfamily N-acetyltransferase
MPSPLEHRPDLSTEQDQDPRIAGLLARFDEQLRRRPPWPKIECADRVIRHVSESWRGVLWSDLDEATADAVIRREIGRFEALGEWEWKLYSYDRPADLADRLRTAGFRPEDEEALLFAPIADLDPTSPTPPGVELRTVADEAGVAALVHVHEEVFGGDYEAFGRELLADLRAGRAAAVVALADGRPISSGRIEFYEGTEFAGLYGGGTLPEWRCRGVFRAIVAHRAALAATRGVRYLQTDASPDSRPILERLGFIRAATTTPFIHR